jgi:Leucine-rich repeat (LRR) protein
MEKLKGRENLWRWLFKRTDEKLDISSFSLISLLQSQSMKRHLRGAWLVSEMSLGEYAFEVLFLNNGPCESLEFLKNLPNMKILILDNTNIPDLSPLEHSLQLKEISLRGATSVDFSILEKLQKLERLVLDRVPQFKDAGVLSELTALKDLDLRGTGITEVFEIPTLPALETLRLGVSELPVSLDGIERFSSLKMLDLTGTEIRGLEKIRQVPNLEKLRINDAKISDPSIIEQKSSLKELCLVNSELSELNLSGLTKLEDLDLLGTKAKLSGTLQSRLYILSVDSFEMLKEVMPDAPDAQKEARETTLELIEGWEIDEMPTFSLTIGQNLEGER